MLRFVPPLLLLAAFTPSFLLADDPAADKFAGQRISQSRNDNALKLTLLWCPPGKFKMGSPPTEPRKHPDEGQVDVTLTRGFWLGKTEVTQGQWTAIMKTTPWKGENFVEEGDDYPATFVDWTQCQEFCKKFTAEERKAGRLPLTCRYDLPTEAQWEYACRAGTTTRFSFGDDQEDLYEYGWYGGLTQDGNARVEQYAHQVGLKKANPFGFHDMHGNVYEWCRGWYGQTYTGGNDPPGQPKGTLYPSRGGAWDRQAFYSRSADRDCNAPDDLGSVQGFRLTAIPDLKD